MSLSPQEQLILNLFDETTDCRLRFHRIACGGLRVDERAAATRALVEKGILAPLADGEYWLTELGAQLLPLS